MAAIIKKLVLLNFVIKLIIELFCVHCQGPTQLPDIPWIVVLIYIFFQTFLFSLFSLHLPVQLLNPHLKQDFKLAT